jgi:hypothetical protein
MLPFTSPRQWKQEWLIMTQINHKEGSMTIEPDDVARLRNSFIMVYASLLSRHQALIHVLPQKIDLPAELLEREVQDWADEHLSAAIAVAQREVGKILDAYGLQLV